MPEIESKVLVSGAVVQSLSHVSLYCDPMDCRPPDFSVHGISQARILEWVAISSARGSSFYPLHWQVNSLPLIFSCELL